MNEFLILKIKNELQSIKSRYEQKYGAVIFDVKVKVGKSSISLEGKVLSKKQKNEVFLAVKQGILENEAELDPRSVSRLAAGIKNKIKVVSDSKEKLGIGWGIIKSDIADIWTIFPDGKDMEERSRATQAIKGDIVRILAKKDNWCLAQTEDLAMGWVTKSQISGIKGLMSIKKWQKTKKAESGKAFKVKLTKKIRSESVSFLEKYLYAPYVWGGATYRGIDCSGLVQKFYLEVFGILLPRHSTDQSEVGQEVDIKSARFGDLAFLRQKAKKFSHIGIIVDNLSQAESKVDSGLGGFLLLNASREKGEVIIQDLPEVLENYNLISVKRLIKA